MSRDMNTDIQQDSLTKENKKVAITVVTVLGSVITTILKALPTSD